MDYQVHDRRKLFVKRLRLIIWLLVGALFMPTMALAETFTYDGTTPALQTTPTWAGGDGITTSLFPLSDLSQNSVTVDFTTGNTPYRVFGGLSDVSAVTGNTVTLLNGTITHNVYGGFTTGTGQEAYDNRVIVNGTGVSARNIIGGYSANGDARYNSVSMSSGTVNGIWGADGSGSHSHNSVLMSGGSAANGINAAYSVSGTLSFNKVTMTDGSVGTNIWGSSSPNGNVQNNSVEISGASTEIGINVLGAYSGNGTASGNSVVMTNGWVKGSVWGAQSEGSNVLSGNTVEIRGGKVGTDGDDTTGQVRGGSNINTGEVSNNTVIMSYGQVLYYLAGGSSKDGDAVNNIVEVSGGTVKSIFGGHSSGLGDANRNSVLITGGDFGAGTNTMHGGLSNKGEASNNLVNISGG